MLAWLEALIAAVSASIIILTIILYLLIRRRSVSNQQVIDTPALPPPSLAKTAPFHSSNKRRKPAFNWADHPSLIFDAVENGWSRFAFANFTPSSSPSIKSSLLRVTGDHNHNQVEFGWELGQGSSDFMQKIRFLTSSSLTARMALPLPGPPPSFPQEGYFEIRVLRSGDDEGDDEEGSKSGESEIVKLIQPGNSCSSSRVLTDDSGFRGTHLVEEVKLGGGRRGGVKMSVGLTAGGSVIGTKMPGSYPGSVGFYSDGSVYLGGMKLTPETEKEDWAKAGKVIGCGFNPNQKKVFFTVDSEMVHVIHCKSEDFGLPLYPILTSNINLTLLVNLGQSSFSFTPANSQRNPNPCFNGPVASPSPAALGYEVDSQELFSMGRVDSEWLNYGTVKSTVSLEDSELEFFEIVLDSSKGKASVNDRGL